MSLDDTELWAAAVVRSCAPPSTDPQHVADAARILVACARRPLPRYTGEQIDAAMAALRRRVEAQ